MDCYEPNSCCQNLAFSKFKLRRVSGEKYCVPAGSPKGSGVYNKNLRDKFTNQTGYVDIPCPGVAF